MFYLKHSLNDEFYTQYQDIEKEIMAYVTYNPNAFKNKTILLPCDDPEWSNFTKFFAQNFERLGIKNTDQHKIKKLNAVYSGHFVSLAKAEFSNSRNSNTMKWSAFIRGSASRQDFLERGLEWGRLYETYKNTAYNPNKASEQVQKLYADPYVKNCKGIFEYILGGSTDSKLLDIRVFDDEINFVKSYH